MANHALPTPKHAAPLHALTKIVFVFFKALRSRTGASNAALGTPKAT